MVHVLSLALLGATVPSEGAGADWISWLRGGGAVPIVSEEASVSASSGTKVLRQNTTQSWDELRQLLEGWEFTQRYAIAVGSLDAAGAPRRHFLYEGGNFTMSTKVPTGSTSKWPSAMMFAGLVNDGTISSLDDPVSKYLKWWTTNPRDRRSLVTFRMLLTFTSGFGDGHPGEEANTRAARQWRRAHNVSRIPRDATFEERLRPEIGAAAATKCNRTTGDITECARSIYEGVKLIGEPGKVFSYNSNHLALAAGVAVAATGLRIDEVVDKYLIRPYGMTDSYYAGSCPDFAGDLITTGADYERFLSGVLRYSPLSKDIVDASEEDATAFLAGQGYTLYGDYGFGHFLACFDSVGGFTEQCRRDRSHFDPGAYGFIPFINRRLGYYMELVTAEVEKAGGTYTLSGIPEYLAVAVKTHVDAIMSGRAGENEEQLHHEPRFLSLSVSDVNYCLDCVLHPQHCD